MSCPSGSIEFRHALPADLPGIVEVEQLSFVHAAERFTHRRVSYLILNPRCIVTVAAADRRVWGWCAGVAWKRGKEPWGRVYALAVHPDARGQRLGQRLLADMIDKLRQIGARRIFLEVRTDNAAAIRLYESSGFVTCRHLPNYYGAGIAGQRMELVK